ncbi:hypothetical protein ACH4T9_26535 [Micromonospora sp. NPDC020750]|uniref:hypothetical protein n=1 Tax=unclassified Micromonospora TaxID=2617518 RepID=UPI003797324B
MVAIGVVRWFDDPRPELSSDMVAGVWQGADRAELSFDGDGLFRASRIPVSLLGSASSGPTTRSGTGKWSIRAAVNDPSEKKTQVALVFEALDGFPVPYSVNLRAESVDGKVVLFWFVGDPDLNRRFILERN